ncbi:MAG: DUF4340 domain-containing protein [Gammaproteobacteria bacterium]|nr:DUF4340 domain-containing protein [Gammaproteobacteria bacterium]
MLSKRWIVNYVLLVLIAALIYAGLRVDEESVSEASAGISKLTAQDIDRLEIESGDSLLKLKRSDGAWMIEAPINWPADGANIERLLGIVDIEASALGNAADVDLAPLGLHHPVAALRFNDSRLVFGTNNNIGARRYTMIESKIYLLPDAHLPFISQGLAGAVDRHLLPQRFVPQSLQLPDFDIRRDDDNGWLSTQARHFTSEQLGQLIANWQGLEASRITRFTLGAASLHVIELQLTDGRIMEFLLISTDPEIVIANPQIGVQYHFQSDYHNRLISRDGDEISG